ncbi:hypothetical protein BDY17DRAFT_320936 [Neohortaea acidophila]|uniref:Uncharacterized protein n=1 Tax=Neohortaea acidophila TaxID=245834 RepID=A0A6A6Q2A0_9PEZI|nr:uncharacterized protein BDY17DRAFT_320936 [Neohortaea acidophila]KAF2486114.1 hypothetical protein BDY17DRAFT_320936 [Neohortaea acidophila]
MAIIKCRLLLAEAKAALVASDPPPAKLTAEERNDEAHSCKWDAGCGEKNRLIDERNEKTDCLFLDVIRAIDRPHDSATISDVLEVLKASQAPVTGWSTYIPEQIKTWTKQSTPIRRATRTHAKTHSTTGQVRDNEGATSKGHQSLTSTPLPTVRQLYTSAEVEQTESAELAEGCKPALSSERATRRTTTWERLAGWDVTLTW